MKTPLLCRVKFWVLVVGLFTCSIARAQVDYWSEVGNASPFNISGFQWGANGYNDNNNGIAGGAICYDNASGNLYFAASCAPNTAPVLAVWNGVSWNRHAVPSYIFQSFADWGIVGSLCTDNIGNVYVGGWYAPTDTTQTNFVLKWNGSTWSELGNSANSIASGYTGGINSMCFDSINNYLYVGIIANAQAIGVWDGSNWTHVGVFSDFYQQSAWPNVFTSNGSVYATGTMYYLYPYSNLRDNIFKYNGTSWVALDNRGWRINSYFDTIVACSGPGNKFYAVGNDSIIDAPCVYEWNDSAWVMLGTGGNPLNINGHIYSLASDKTGNVYAAGDFTDNNGYHYGAKWNGSMWTELGVNNLALHANDYINLLTVDSSSNVYTAGAFTTLNGFTYLAKYGPFPPGRLFAFPVATPAYCGNTGTINCGVYNGTLPYHFAWSNGASSANLSSLASGTYYVTVTDANGLIATGDVVVPGSCQSIISGTVFVDAAGTCTYNGHQAVIPDVILTLSGDTQTLYATTDENGKYSFAVSDTGNYYLYIQQGNAVVCGNFTLCGNPNQIIHLGTLGDTSSANNFALTPDSSSFDLYLHPGWTSAAPGFEKDYWVYFANNSTVPFTATATVTFKYDPNLSFISSDIPYTSYNAAADSITWVVNNFSNTGWNYIGKVHFNVPSTLPLGYQLRSQFWIYPDAGDCDTSNNYLQYFETVKGSHDPNYKEVAPARYTTDADSVLTYTIHYQNTGTDSTYFITIKDTLSPYLNPATVRNLASSHSYSSFTISGAGVLTWTFVPLSLPAASMDSMGSNGFITFSVHRMANAPLGAVISNSASVYFDYNNPVLTNRVTDTVVHTCTDTTNQFASLCAGDSIYFYSRWLHNAGSYDTLVAGNPCDTFATLTLVVQDPLPPHHISYTMCASDSLLFANSNLHTTGTYSHIGCDSLVILALTVLPVPVTTITQTTCWNQPYYGHYTTGQYTDTFTIATGCDSIRILNLTVMPVTITYDTVSVCHGQSYLGYTATGNYTDTITGINSCDKIRNLNLTVLPALSNTITTSVCQGQSYQGYTATGIYTDTLTGSHNCDSIVSIYLTVNAVAHTSISDSICQGDSYLFNDTLRNLTGAYIGIYNGANSCDSISVLSLTVLPNPLQPYITQQSDSLISSNATGNQWYMNDTIMPGETSEVLIVNQTGNYSLRLTGPNGCQNTSAEYYYLGSGFKWLQNAFMVNLYPNPSNGNFIIDFSDNVAKDISVTDMLGQTVVGVRRVILKSELDLSLLADGVYQLKVTDVQNTNKVVLKQLVIQH